MAALFGPPPQVIWLRWAISLPCISKHCSATTPRPSPHSSMTLLLPAWRSTEAMNRRATINKIVRFMFTVEAAR